MSGSANAILNLVPLNFEDRSNNFQTPNVQVITAVCVNGEHQSSVMVLGTVLGSLGPGWPI
jgi:hypothetical protein